MRRYFIIILAFYTLISINVSDMQTYPTDTNKPCVALLRPIAMAERGANNHALIHVDSQGQRYIHVPGDDTTRFYENGAVSLTEGTTEKRYTWEVGLVVARNGDILIVRTYRINPDALHFFNTENERVGHIYMRGAGEGKVYGGMRVFSRIRGRGLMYAFLDTLFAYARSQNITITGTTDNLNNPAVIKLGLERYGFKPVVTDTNNAVKIDVAHSLGGKIPIQFVGPKALAGFNADEHVDKSQFSIQSNLPEGTPVVYLFTPYYLADPSAFDRAFQANSRVFLNGSLYNTFNLLTGNIRLPPDLKFLAERTTTIAALSGV